MNNINLNTGKIREAAIKLAAYESGAKNAALVKIAEKLIKSKQDIAQINSQDVEAAINAGLPQPIVKRLKMDEKKIEDVAAGLRSLIALPDPVGAQLLATELDDGLALRKVTCPIGVIGVIFESRPDALVQIAGLCLKSGNAVILKGGSETAGTNRLLTSLIREATTGAGLPEHWISQLETRAEIKEMLKMDDCIDLLIPRGSYDLVKYIMDNTRIPVIGHSDGLCHCYVDAAADIDMAVKVVVDTKTQYAAVCNATETLLVHRDVAQAFLPALWEAFNGGAREAPDGGATPLNGDSAETPDGGATTFYDGTAEALDGGATSFNGDSAEAPSGTIRGCDETRRILANHRVEPASDGEWSAEYLDYILAVKVVGSAAEAIDHINRYGSRHTDAIITDDAAAADDFMMRVDSANVFHNCSTRFSDGFRYGFGAEVGVSTSKIHARGPVGLEGLVTYKFLLAGNGNIVADYEQGKRKFTHKQL
jgi:glutamate-5-semialdehyde dehydrogenase